MTAVLFIKTGENRFGGRMEMSEGMPDWGHISVVATSGLQILTTNLFLHGEKVRICIRVLLVSVPAPPSHVQTGTSPLFASKLAETDDCVVELFRVLATETGLLALTLKDNVVPLTRLDKS
jgi:hypothetical protein